MIAAGFAKLHSVFRLPHRYGALMVRCLEASRNPNADTGGQKAANTSHRADDYLTTAQVATMLHKHPRTVRRYIECHGLPASRVGRGYLTRRKDLDEWMTDNGYQ